MLLVSMPSDAVGPGGVPSLIAIVMGLAGAVLVVRIGEPAWDRMEGRDTRLRLRLPDWAMSRRIVRPQATGCTVGTVKGVTLVAGGTIAALVAYGTLIDVEREIDRGPAGRTSRTMA
ncbi:hypothetical protein [Muricoccus radiodurans]|uniref:hypothetical protein n=1 Tax=Muricoccus radiodurans TaxID=2231721 RepID=UPI003CF584D4